MQMTPPFQCCKGWAEGSGVWCQSECHRFDSMNAFSYTTGPVGVPKRHACQDQMLPRSTCISFSRIRHSFLECRRLFLRADSDDLAVNDAVGCSCFDERVR